VRLKTPLLAIGVMYLAGTVGCSTDSPAPSPPNGAPANAAGQDASNEEKSAGPDEGSADGAVEHAPSEGSGD